MEPGGGRRAGAEVFSEGRRSQPTQAGSGGGCSGVSLALGGRPGGAGRPARGRTLRQRNLGQAGLQPACGDVGLLGLEGWLFHDRGGCPGILRRDPAHAGHPEGGPEFTAMVQHRAPLGIRDQGNRAGPPLCGFRDRPGQEIEELLRTAAASCLLHPVNRG